MSSLRIQILFVLVPVTVFFMTGCELLSSGNDSVEAPQAVSMRSIDEEAVAEAMQVLLASERFRARLLYADTLHTQYRERVFVPVWVRGEGFPARVAGILRFLLRAEDHGLDPLWYHAPQLEALLDDLLAGRVAEAKQDETLGTFELLLSDGLLRYSNHLRFGVVDPRRIDAGYHLPVQRGGLREFLEPLSTPDIIAYLTNIQPTDTRYLRLQAAYAGFRDIKRLYRWPRIPDLGVDKLEVGQSSHAVPALAQRLLLTGELFASSQAPLRGTVQLVDLALHSYELDSMRLQTLGSFVYDSTLARAVIRYQERHGLLVDGIVGVRTIARMNRGVDAYVDQIRATLERFRWLRYPESGRYVVVNIPEYWLYAVKDGEVEATMSVCVGEPRPAGYAAQYQVYQQTGKRRHEPKNHETPQITGEFTHCIVNPFWHVPWSIAAREIYYSAKRDSNYLNKGRYKVYYRDSLVDASSIDWADHNPYSMPYKFKQEPGRGNALGAIKFMFQNDHSIYLHDTPQQWAFKRAVRAVSHGCVRIAKPMDFARYLLDGTPDWDVARLQQTIWSGARSKPVFLHQKTPLFIDYYTAWVDDAGVLQFRDDIYRKDAILTRLFQRMREHAGA